jgi:hypothetical protein
MRIVAAGALATPAAVEAATVAPADAATLALKQCISHVQGETKIVGANAKSLEAMGFSYQRDPPEFLQATKSTVLGRAEYARAPAEEGEVWAIGYDAGSCMVVTMAVTVDPIETGYKAVFAEPGTWRSTNADRAPEGQRNEKYQFDPNRTLKLTAMVNYRPDQGITSATVTRRNR